MHGPFEARRSRIKYYSNKLSSPEFNKNHPDNRHKNVVYAAMVNKLDESVGRLLDFFDRTGNEKIRENTLILFMSDNGGAVTKIGRSKDHPFFHVTSNFPLKGSKHSLYEGGVRVSAIARWPGVIEEGSTSSVPVSTIDLYPTFLEIAGENPGEVYKGQKLSGKSLVSLFRGEERAEEELRNRPLFFHRTRYGVWHHPDHDEKSFEIPATTVRMGDWKLWRSLEPGYELQLFNLRDDIGETTNMVSAFPEKADELERLIEEWHKKSGVYIPLRNPDFLGVNFFSNLLDSM